MLSRQRTCAPVKHLCPVLVRAGVQMSGPVLLTLGSNDWHGSVGAGLLANPVIHSMQRCLAKCVRQQAGSYRWRLMPRQVNRADDAVFDRAARGFGHDNLFARQASRDWPSPVGAGFQRLARSRRRRDSNVWPGPVGAGLLANPVTHSMQRCLSKCVRQQAGSYRFGLMQGRLTVLMSRLAVPPCGVYSVTTVAPRACTI